MSTIEFIAYGTPAPQGSKRFVGTSKAGKGLMVESSAKVKPWRMDVKAAAEIARAKLGRTLDGPLRVEMYFTLPKPKSAPKTRVTYPDRKPDGSKLLRSTEDAITDAGLWADDARVVDGRAVKRFPDEGLYALSRPGVWVRIVEIGALL